MKRLCHWLYYRRECGWCGRWLGGNPFSTARTHGVCDPCAAAFRAELNSTPPPKSQTNASAGPPVAVRPAAGGNLVLCVVGLGLLGALVLFQYQAALDDAFLDGLSAAHTLETMHQLAPNHEDHPTPLAGTNAGPATHH